MCDTRQTTISGEGEERGKEKTLITVVQSHNLWCHVLDNLLAASSHLNVGNFIKRQRHKVFCG